MSASTATRTDEFTDFVRSHSSVLMRSACLIAGDRGKGEDLFRRAAPPVELDDARAEALAPAPDPYGAVDDRLDIVARLGLSVAAFESGIAMWSEAGDGFLVSRADGVQRFEAGSTTATPLPVPEAAPATLSCQPPAGLIGTTADPLTLDMAYVRFFHGARLYLDPVEFLTGQDAIDAAREAGMLGEDGTVPNDYWISNDDTALVVVPVADGFEASLIDTNTEGRVLAGRLFADLYCGGEATWLYGGLDNLLVNVVVRNGEVTLVEQTYVP